MSSSSQRRFDCAEKDFVQTAALFRQLWKTRETYLRILASY